MAGFLQGNWSKREQGGSCGVLYELVLEITLLLVLFPWVSPVQCEWGLFKGMNIGRKILHSSWGEGVHLED